MTIVIEVPVPSQESEQSCMYAILPLSTILIFDFGIVPTLRYFCFSFDIKHDHIYFIYIPMIKYV
jgi:membrane protein YdbS with pleckstrin-like domain